MAAGSASIDFSQPSGTAYAMFLKQFSGEVLATFTAASKLGELGIVKTIKNGQSAQFPCVGTASASFHTLGDDIFDAAQSYVSAIGSADKTVYVDNVLLAATAVPKIEELENHFDTRMHYAKELGNALARKRDLFISRTLALCAIDPTSGVGGHGSVTSLAGGTRAANITGVTGTGTVITNAFDPTHPSFAAGFVAALFQAAAQLDTNNVPAEDRFVVMHPRVFHAISGQMVTGGGNPLWLYDKDYQATANVNALQVPTIAGFQVVVSTNVGYIGAVSTTAGGNYAMATGGGVFDASKANNLVQVVGSDAAVANGYGINLTACQAVAFHKSAFGRLSLMDVQVESAWDIRSQATLMVAKVAEGYGVLRPEAAVVIAKA